ncbi:MAG: septum formation initiator family protein [Actinobacteria bacterium]|jgi:cell division protein FtsB|nr:septum formation initiator family protein [Actinomycetota bacterium]
MARTSGFTRPIPKEDRVIQRRSGQAIAWPVGILVVIAFVVALLILPVRQWVNQRRDVARAKEELVALADANAELAKEIEKLRTPEGVEMAIRTELGFVKPGEQPLEILDDPSAPKKLPKAWPYTMVSNILIVRAEAAKSAAEDDDGVLSPLTP